nr:MAG TPA_asm: hypothetical protein [Caudoviricetes sp.]
MRLVKPMSHVVYFVFIVSCSVRIVNLFLKIMISKNMSLIFFLIS